MHCRNCGQKINSNEVFCPNCGTRITAVYKQVSSRSKRKASVQDGEQKNSSGKVSVANANRMRLWLKITAIVCLATILVCMIMFLYFAKRDEPFGGLEEQQIHVGDTVQFGSYEQDNDTSDGKEPIEWTVLSTEDDMVMLASTYCLDCMPYNTAGSEIDWESSSIREWLNDNFLDSAFSQWENIWITRQPVENPGVYAGLDINGSWIVTNSMDQVEDVLYHTDGSDVTKDKVCLLSVDEAIIYLGSGIIGDPQLTEYAKEKFLMSITEQAESAGVNEEMVREQYAKIEEEYGENRCYWWLRSPGFTEDSASAISYDGIGIQAQSVSEIAAVRPILWVRRID